MKKVNSKDIKVKQGGVMINRELVKILAPLGVNNMGASIIILILLYIVNKSKKMIGGGSDSEKDTKYLNKLKEKLSKYKPNCFQSVSILGGAAALFDRKIYGSESGIKVSVKKLRDNLKNELKSI